MTDATDPQPVRLLLDSNIFDQLLASDGVAVALRQAQDDGRCRVIITHVQTDEISATLDPERRAQLFSVMAFVNPRQEPTAGFVLGSSRLDAARLDFVEEVEEVRGSNLGRSRDALIASIATVSADVLVTEDQPLGRQALERLGCHLWRFEDLARWLGIPLR